MEVADLTLEEECKKWKESYEKANKMLEDKSQLLHITGNKLTFCEALKSDLILENESLKLECQVILEAKKKLEEQLKHSTVENESNVEVANHSREMAEKLKEIENLKLQLGNLNTELRESHAKEIEMDKVIHELNDKNTLLTDSLHLLQSHFDQLFAEKEELKAEHKEALAKIADLDEGLVNSKKELAVTKSLITDLQGELQLLKIEKEQPSCTNTRGNSVFAEVDDKRREVQEDMEFMKTNYEKMKIKCKELIEKNAKCIQKNKDICNQWKHDIKEIPIEVEAFEQHLQRLFSHLETLIQSMNASESRLQNNNSTIALIKEKQNQIEEMNKYVKQKTLMQFQVLQQLKKKHHEARDLQQRLMEAQVNS